MTLKPAPARVSITLQQQSAQSGIPDMRQLQQWIDLALSAHQQNAEITVRIVDEKESAKLNRRFRHKNKPTNVLSFIIESTPCLIGDLVICAPVVQQEAELQQKELTAHWAHMVIHGTLHLLGYDHIETADADKMETLETQLLNQSGYSNPYAS